MKIARPYQTEIITHASNILMGEDRKIILQLSTGGGKTFIASSICQRYLSRNIGRRILILVHRIELLNQFRRTLHNDFNIAAHPLKAGTRWIPDANIYVGMVDSAYNRLNRLPPIDMVFIDECHLANFFKMHAYFDQCDTPPLVIGMTATPISSNKKKPLKNYYSNIVCGPEISELIKLGALAQNITFAPTDIVNRAELAMKSNGEFDERDMGEKYKLPKFINNTVKAYERLAAGEKTIVFNVNVAHSKAVCDAFVAAGHNCRHIDGTETPYRRTAILKWFEDTPGAILCNVAITTVGTDIPSTECILFNKATTSVALWLQATGRGSRPTHMKSSFKIIDMGGNAITHGDWSSPRDWQNIFHNPPKPGKEGVAPCKSCPQCDAIVPAGVKNCPYCGYVWDHPEDELLEEDLHEFVVVTRGIDVADLIARNSERKQYYTFFLIGKRIAEQLHKKLHGRPLTEQDIRIAMQSYERLGGEWCAANKRPYNRWHEKRAQECLMEELKKKFGQVPEEAQSQVSEEASGQVPENSPAETVPISQEPEMSCGHLHSEQHPEPTREPAPAVRPLISIQPLNLMSAI